MSRQNSDRVEWSWSSAPILLPLAFEKREWNAIYIAFYVAECTGSPIRVIHVNRADEDEHSINRFIDELTEFSLKLKVKFEVERVSVRKDFPGVTDIANEIVAEAEEHDVQMIIMSAHREAFFRELFGRVSDHTARKACVIVVLVETPWAGLSIPKAPKRILIPSLDSKLVKDAFILATAITSSASVPDVEIVAAKVVELPPTVPLDAVEVSESLRAEERQFSSAVALHIGALGRLFTPKIIPVREVGREIADYAKEMGADLMILSSRKPSGFRSLLTRSEYGIVRRAPCVSLVVFPKRSR